MNRKLFYLIGFFALAIACSCSKGPDSPTAPGTDPVNPGTPQTPQKPAVQYIGNWNMEEDVNLEMVDIKNVTTGNWSYVGGWAADRATPKQMGERGFERSRCLVLTAKEETDVMYAQKVTGLDPSKPYIASGRIKAEAVSKGKGGSLSLDYLWAPTSEGVTGTTKDYKYVELEIDEINPDGSVVLCLRLGYTAASSSGTVYFDNVSLRENTNLYIRESEHIRLMINKKYAAISDAQVDEWLANLDKVYEAYVELFSGREPFEGKKITLRSAIIDAWAYAGNPVQWNQDYITAALSNVGKGDWCFGIMHELGHDFAPYISNATYAFNWNEELFANFRMYYALEKTNAVVITDANILNPDGTSYTQTKTYVGAEIKQLYKSETTNCYDRTIAQNKSVEMGNALCYKLIQIKEKYGWELFMNVFDDLYKQPRNEGEEQEMNQWDKFEYFMEFVNRHAGENVYNTCFTSAELNTIRTYLSTQK